MDNTNFLRKYLLAKEVATPYLDCYNYETISKICAAILEAAMLKEYLNEISDGDLDITLKEALSKIESEKKI